MWFNMMRWTADNGTREPHDLANLDEDKLTSFVILKASKLKKVVRHSQKLPKPNSKDKNVVARDANTSQQQSARLLPADVAHIGTPMAAWASLILVSCLTSVCDSLNRRSLSSLMAALTCVAALCIPSWIWVLSTASRLSRRFVERAMAVRTLFRLSWLAFIIAADGAAEDDAAEGVPMTAAAEEEGPPLLGGGAMPGVAVRLGSCAAVSPPLAGSGMAEGPGMPAMGVSGAMGPSRSNAKEGSLPLLFR
ncbi:hypothetical protein F5883DRAFT_541399 [Diaporthe sp. PMI_573]|nr:hypothetical protein F5883DRAFT_541399 [Diaporthaceae sp. PMI_573]